jgi:preprotein translocase subunit YajC
MNPAAQPSIFEMLMPFVFIFAIFYFLILRPQTKRMKEQDAMLKKLQKGDAIVTNSGLLGVIDAINESIVTLEVSPQIKIKMLRKQIAGLQAAVLQTEGEKKS